MILTSGNAKDLDGLEEHYDVKEVWSGSSDIQDVKMLSGFGDSWWHGVEVETFVVPGNNPIVKFIYQDKSLVYSEKGTEGLWEAFRDPSQVDFQVGPEYTRGRWSGDGMADIFRPTAIFTNKVLQNVSISTEVIGDRELVW